MNYDGIKDIPESILHASIRIVDEVERNLNVTLISTAALALSDHINFAIQRLHQHIGLAMAMQEDVKQLYPDEMREAYHALAIIKEETGITLDRNEASTIALHFINSRINENMTEQIHSEKIIEQSICMIEKEFQITINKDSFNYSRFVTHVDYLLKRTLKNVQIESSNNKLYESIMEQYPTTYLCCVHIKKLFNQLFQIDLNQEEQLYLMLHINRLCSREQDSK